MLFAHAALSNPTERQPGSGRGAGDEAAAAAAAAVVAAEDELLLLWSSVERDRAAVLDRRRQLLGAGRQPRGPKGRAAPAQAQGLGGEGAGGGGGGEVAAGVEEDGEEEAGRARLLPGGGGNSGWEGGGGGGVAPAGSQQGGARAAPPRVVEPPTLIAATAAAGIVNGTAGGGGWSSARGGEDDAGSCGGAGGGEPGRERTLAHTLWCMLIDVAAVARGPERRAFALAAGLAVFDQVRRRLTGIRLASARATAIAPCCGEGAPAVCRMPPLLC
jgi:hypothetical protein